MAMFWQTYLGIGISLYMLALMIGRPRMSVFAMVIGMIVSTICWPVILLMAFSDR